MDTNKIECKINLSITYLLLQYFFIVILSILFALLLHRTLIKYLDIYHTVLELSCIFISLSIFISVWYTYHISSVKVYILGFGYLAVAVFDVLHTLYLLKLNLNLNSYFDLSTRYWILGRITEALVLYIFVIKIKTKLNKWLALYITLFLAIGVAVFVNVYHDYLPILLTKQGVTPIKIILEFLVIMILFLTLLNIIGKISKRNKFILMAILLAISSEICFTLYITVDSFIWTIGHILKITSYYFLFKGIFISTVTYPYEKLENEHIKLDTAYKELDESHLLAKKLAHETRNFLTTIKGRCQLIDLITDDDNIKLQTTKINNYLDDVNENLNDFLVFSKPKQAKIKEISSGVIFNLIKDMIETSSFTKELNVEYNYSMDDRFLLCDIIQLKQVILNICKNAIEAMECVKEPKLKIYFGYEEQLNEIFIKITDNGVGIAKDKLDKLGTKYYSTKMNGAGLGLNICHDIIKEHKGKISIESEMGKGTTFKVALPCLALNDELSEVSYAPYTAKSGKTLGEGFTPETRN